MRTKQIKRGLEAGRKELIKMTSKNLLCCPLIYLLLCDMTEGPPFLRAVLHVLYKAGAPDDVTLIRDHDFTDWGNFMYSKDGLRMPPEEGKYYNILREEVDNVVLWWRQFCLNWECLVPDL